MSTCWDHPAAIRQGEELDVAMLEPYFAVHFFPTKRRASKVANFSRAVIQLDLLTEPRCGDLVLRRPPFEKKKKKRMAGSKSSPRNMGRGGRISACSQTHSVYAPASCSASILRRRFNPAAHRFYVMDDPRPIILRRTLPLGLDFPAEKSHGGSSRILLSTNFLFSTCTVWITLPWVLSDLGGPGRPI